MLAVDGTDMTLVLWDIHGDDQFQAIRTSYLRGTAGYLLVVDGTRRTTLDKALDIKRTVDQTLGDVPFILVLNKADLTDAWEVPILLEDELKDKWVVLRSSAKTGEGVEEAFARLARALI